MSQLPGGALLICSIGDFPGRGDDCWVLLCSVFLPDTISLSLVLRADRGLLLPVESISTSLTFRLCFCTRVLKMSSCSSTLVIACCFFLFEKKSK